MEHHNRPEAASALRWDSLQYDKFFHVIITMQQLTQQDARFYSTFRLPANLQHIWLVSSLTELDLLPIDAAAPPLVLGEGSNSIFLTDQSQPILRFLANSVQWQINDDEVKLHVEAGHNWHQLVLSTCAAGLWGLENLALIPGSVGAAPVQNIGAYGAEFAQCCEYVDFYSFASRAVVRMPAAACQFGYRESIFKHHLLGRGLIVAVGLTLSKHGQPNRQYRGLEHLADDANSSEVAQAVIALRQQKLPDPSVIGNCGSFFKNPILSAAAFAQLQQQYPTVAHFNQADGSVKVAAAWLMEQCGLKGAQRDGIGCYEKQPLVLVNLGTGTAAALLSWVSHIQHLVWQRFAVQLEPEVRMYDRDGQTYSA
jgi:UDP-N-acetylmuramate dehydrogenase